METTNYRTVKLPTGMDVPLFVKAEFKDFYKAMFAEQVRREDMRTVFLEYAWDMSWCDPCAADPLSPEELARLGVRGGSGVFLSRLHLRYDAAHFPEDLVFQETADRENFQGRDVLRHAWSGSPSCPEAGRYRSELSSRREKEAQTLATLTGWRVDAIRRKVDAAKITSLDDAPSGREAPPRPSWYERAWTVLTME